MRRDEHFIALIHLRSIFVWEQIGYVVRPYGNMAKGANKCLIRSVRQGRILPPIHVRKRFQEGLVLVSCVTPLLGSQEKSECRPHRLLHHVLNREAAHAYQPLRASSPLFEIRSPVWLVAVFLKVLVQVIKRSSQPAFSVCRPFLFWI